MRFVLAPVIIALCAAGAALAASPAERVAAISYQMQTRAAGLCADTAPMASFLIANEQSATVEIVVPKAPAARAGVQPGDVISSINDRTTDQTNIADLIDAALDSGSVALQLRDGRLLRFTVEQGCGIPVGLQPGASLDAYADANAVAVSAGMADFARTDDELALIIGHELAHIILKHKNLLDAAHVSRGLLAGLGRNGDRIRKTEEEADMLALYLMARSGYDIDAAPAFWERFGDRTGAGVFSDGTHPRTKARVALARATIAAIRAQQRRDAPLVPPSVPTR